MFKKMRRRREIKKQIENLVAEIYKWENYKKTLLPGKMKPADLVLELLRRQKADLEDEYCTI